MAIWDRWLKRDTSAATQIAALESEVKRLTEALPGIYDPDANLSATGGGSRYFRPLSKSDRDLSPMQHDKAQSLAYYLWETNPFAKRITNLTVDYVLGEGITVQAKDDDKSLSDAMQKRIDLFWYDPINRMDLKLFDKVRELGLYGEQCWSVHINPVDGHVRLGYIDPAIIVDVIVDPRNQEIPQAVKLRSSPGQPDLYYRVVHVDERPGSKSFGRLVGREDIDGEPAEIVFDPGRQDGQPVVMAGECLYFSVNKVSNARRGRPDLLAITDWVDGYDQFISGELDRLLLMKGFIWDVTLTGLQQSEIDAYARQQGPPSPGSVRYHNDKVVWQAVTPDLKAVDTIAHSDLLAGYIATGSGLAKTWLNATDNVNKASATELSEPTFKYLTARQRYCRYVIEHLITLVLDQAELHGALPKRASEPGTRRPTPWAFEAQFPELRPKDLNSLSSTFNQTMDAIVKARSELLIDEETAQEVVAMSVGLLGVEVDIEAMRKRLEKEQKERDEQMAMAPYGMEQPGQPNDAPQDTAEPQEAPA